MKSSNYKYEFVVTANKVIALSSFAGRTVRGIAKCHPNDTFDVEYGKRLAAARCNEKIARKRYTRALNRYHECDARLTALTDEFQETCDYFTDAYRRWQEAVRELDDL